MYSFTLYIYSAHVKGLGNDSEFPIDQYSYWVFRKTQIRKIDVIFLLLLFFIFIHNLFKKLPTIRTNYDVTSHSYF